MKGDHDSNNFHMIDDSYKEWYSIAIKHSSVHQTVPKDISCILRKT